MRLRDPGGGGGGGGTGGAHSAANSVAFEGSRRATQQRHASENSLWGRTFSVGAAIVGAAREAASDAAKSRGGPS